MDLVQGEGLDNFAAGDSFIFRIYKHVFEFMDVTIFKFHIAIIVTKIISLYLFTVVLLKFAQNVQKPMYALKSLKFYFQKNK